MPSCPIPNVSPAETRWRRLADRYRGVVAPIFRAPVGIAVAAGVAVAGNFLPARTALGLLATFLLAIGGYCVLNFWRCREAHCLMTGMGWTGAGLAALVAMVGRYQWRDGLWATFLAVWVLGFAFEGFVRWRLRTNVLR